MHDPDNRFGMPQGAFEAALDSHGRDNPTIRFCIYVPTRREVAENSPDWLHSVLIDWMWESPRELIPNNEQISEIRAVLCARPDAESAELVKLIEECDDYLKISVCGWAVDTRKFRRWPCAD